jgi:hypothetical protein
LVARKDNGCASEETFDEFLAEQRMLETCEDLAMKEVIAARLAGDESPRLPPKKARLKTRRSRRAS